MRRMTGWYSIILGTIILICGFLAIQPVDWHDKFFVASFIAVVLISFALILRGFFTTNTPKKDSSTKAQSMESKK